MAGPEPNVRVTEPFSRRETLSGVASRDEESSVEVAGYLGGRPMPGVDRGAISAVATAAERLFAFPRGDCVDRPFELAFILGSAFGAAVSDCRRVSLLVPFTTPVWDVGVLTP